MNIDYLISLSIAIVLGFALGLERELTNKNAGLRTHIFVCLGSCVFTLPSIHGFPTFAIGDNVIIDQHYLIVNQQYVSYPLYLTS